MQYPGLEPVLDDLLPKKVPLIVVKWFVALLLLLLQVRSQSKILFCNMHTLGMMLTVSFVCSQNHLNLVLVNSVPLFFNIRDGPYMPTLRLLHQCKFFIIVPF